MHLHEPLSPESKKLVPSQMVDSGLRRCKLTVHVAFVPRFHIPPRQYPSLLGMLSQPGQYLYENL